MALMPLLCKAYKGNESFSQTKQFVQAHSADALAPTGTGEVGLRLALAAPGLAHKLCVQRCLTCLARMRMHRLQWRLPSPQ